MKRATCIILTTLLVSCGTLSPCKFGVWFGQSFKCIERENK